eukprot:9270403-Pyramimonas_sp.AAC.1
MLQWSRNFACAQRAQASPRLTACNFFSCHARVDLAERNGSLARGRLGEGPRQPTGAGKSSPGGPSSRNARQGTQMASG